MTPLRYVALGAIVLLMLLGLYWAYLFFSSSSMVRFPMMEHAHFRMQIVAEGVKQDFSSISYQIPYEKGVCSAELSNEPLHFHDVKDQIVHVHWKGTTGGDVLKYYGWNLIGGPDTIMGYRFDKSIIPKPVPIHGTSLPSLSAHTKLWVYAGNQDNYRQRSLTDFLNQSLEEFFGRKSTVNTDMVTELQKLFASTAYAHDGHDHNDAKTPAQLEAINNLLGNVVLFAQHDEPSPESIKERFSSLEPLTDSTCGG